MYLELLDIELVRRGPLYTLSSHIKNNNVETIWLERELYQDWIVHGYLQQLLSATERRSRSNWLVSNLHLNSVA